MQKAEFDKRKPAGLNLSGSACVRAPVLTLQSDVHYSLLIVGYINVIFVLFFPNPAVVVSYRPPWLMLIKPRPHYFTGKRTGFSHLVLLRFVLSCAPFYFQGNIVAAATAGDG